MPEPEAPELTTPTAAHVLALECLLFAAPGREPLTIERLAEVLLVEQTELPGLMQQLEGLLAGRGLQLAKLAGGYTLQTRPQFAEYVQRLLEPDPEKLSVQALETLAIIAYRQPMTRPEVDDVRGVNSSGTVTSLLEKDLIRIAGRRDAPGRPFLFETTPHFLSIFGLSDLDELPELGELKRRLDRHLPLAPDDLAAADEEPVDSGEVEADVPDNQPDEGRDTASAILSEGQTEQH